MSTPNEINDDSLHWKVSLGFGMTHQEGRTILLVQLIVELSHVTILGGRQDDTKHALKCCMREKTSRNGKMRKVSPKQENVVITMSTYKGLNKRLYKSAKKDDWWINNNSSGQKHNHRDHHKCATEKVDLKEDNTAIRSFNNLDEDALRHVMSYCDLSSLIKLCQTSKRLMKVGNAFDEHWNQYESMIPRSSRWRQEDQHPVAIARIRNSTTSKMKVISYVRASRYASKLQPLVPDHSASNSSEDHKTEADDVVDGRPKKCSQCDIYPNTLKTFDSSDSYSNYGFFVRLFQLPHSAANFPSSVMETTRQKYLLLDPKRDVDDSLFLWQGFVDINGCCEWTNKKGQTIELQTQPGFDFLNDIPHLHAEHTRLRRWFPLTNLANNIGIIVVGIHRRTEEMSLVYASTEISRRSMFFSHLNFELTNLYCVHPPPPPPQPTPHTSHRGRYGGINRRLAKSPATASSVWGGAINTSSGMTMKRRVSMKANTTNYDTARSSSLTFKIEEGDANRIGFLGCPRTFLGDDSDSTDDDERRNDA